MSLEAEVRLEQEVLDRARLCLERMRAKAKELYQPVLELGAGGTFQARYERNVAVDYGTARLAQLEIGDEPLCFGRVDRVAPEAEGQVESFHLGRLAIWDENQDPVVVDWRAPVAEPFYRATPRDPMGLVRRRHLDVRQGRVSEVEDEWLSPPPEGSKLSQDLKELAASSGEDVVTYVSSRAPSALLSAVSRPRTSYLADIVSTIQAGQDEVIRAPLRGVLVIQGGPGTGKTAVALHRAAYLLYTYRDSLEKEGILLIGPNPIFLHYISRVLPSLGEGGVVLATPARLYDPGRKWVPEDSTVSIKGDPRMAQVLAKALSDRERPLRSDLEVKLGPTAVTLKRRELIGMVQRTKELKLAKNLDHNKARSILEKMIVSRLAERVFQRQSLLTKTSWRSSRNYRLPSVKELESQLRHTYELKVALERMWPLLEPEQFLDDLMNFPSLLASAASGILTETEQRALIEERKRMLAKTRPSGSDARETEAEQSEARAAGVRHSHERSHSLRTWSLADAALLDEAAWLLGPIGFGLGRSEPSGNGEPPLQEGPSWLRHFGYVLIDEAQDLTPMERRMISRRVPSARMTVVGDLDQATSPLAPSTWTEVLEDLTRFAKSTREPLTKKIVSLDVSYRTPKEIMEVAAGVLQHSAQMALEHGEARRAPRTLRASGVPVRWLEASEDQLVQRAAEMALEERRALGKEGTLALIAPDELREPLIQALVGLGLLARDPGGGQLGQPVSVLGLVEAKGLELDAVILLEPKYLVKEVSHGDRALYMALTRATQRLSIVYSIPLPDSLELARLASPSR